MRIILLIALYTVSVAANSQTTDRRQFDPVPAKVSGALNGGIPSDAVVLFDGSNFDAWQTATDEEPVTWKIENGTTTVTPGSRTIKTKQSFGDYQLHLEWATSELIEGAGQGRSNSGVFLHSLFEVQILDSWENPTYVNGQAGSVYLQYPPLVDAAARPGQWQSFDIIFNAPKYDSNGDLNTPAYVSVLHNGVLVHNHVELKGATYTPMPEYSATCTPYGQPIEQDCSGRMPITLQDHGQVVSFRNIWLREL